MFFRYFLTFTLLGAVVTQNKPKALSYLDGLFMQWLNSNQTFYQENSLELRERCEEHKKLDELPRAQRALQDAVEYLEQSFDINHIRKEIQKSDTEQKARELYCNIKSDVILSYRKIFGAFQFCLIPIELELLYWPINLEEAFAESICSIDSETFEKFIALNETVCMEKKTTAIQTCVKNTTTELLPYENTIFDFFSRLRLHFKENECSQISDFQTCVTPVIADCSPGLKIIELLFNDIRRAVKCQVMISEDNVRETKNLPMNSTSSKEIFEDSVLDVTSFHFSKIIEKELSEIPKKKRIDCMQEILGILKNYII